MTNGDDPEMTSRHWKGNLTSKTRSESPGFQAVYRWALAHARATDEHCDDAVAGRELGVLPPELASCSSSCSFASSEVQRGSTTHVSVFV